MYSLTEQFYIAICGFAALTRKLLQQRCLIYHAALMCIRFGLRGLADTSDRSDNFGFNISFKISYLSCGTVCALLLASCYLPEFAMRLTPTVSAQFAAQSAQFTQRAPNLLTKQLLKLALVLAAVGSSNVFAHDIFMMNIGSLIEVALVQTEPVNPANSATAPRTESATAASGAASKDAQDKKRELSTKETLTPAANSMRSVDNKDTKLKIVIM